MAGEQLKPMVVNPGDPITSELMANVVSNINVINSLSNSVFQESSSDQDKPKQILVDSGKVKVVCKSANNGSAPVTFTKDFTAAPNVTLSVRHTGTDTIATYKYQPVVTDLTASGFNVKMQSLSTSNKSGGTLWVHWIAVS